VIDERAGRIVFVSSKECIDVNLPIYLISLPRSVQRRDRITKQLSTLGLLFQHFEALDGRELWEELRHTVDLQAFERNTGRHVMQGEIGCYHSHLEVWKKLAAQQAEIALVLEDDVLLHDDFREALDAAIASASKWDILKLSKMRAKHPVTQLKLSKWTINAYLGAATGTGSYLIKREVAINLLPKMLPITRPIDHEIDRSHVHNLRHFGLEPFPSHVDDGGESTITGTAFSDVEKFSKWKRIPNYILRSKNLVGKSKHALLGLNYPKQ
jgi:glycosyl transferase family 25